jgi:hypothetical protein
LTWLPTWGCSWYQVMLMPLQHNGSAKLVPPPQGLSRKAQHAMFENAPKLPLTCQCSGLLGPAATSLCDGIGQSRGSGLRKRASTCQRATQGLCNGLGLSASKTCGEQGNSPPSSTVQIHSQCNSIHDAFMFWLCWPLAQDQPGAIANSNASLPN